MTFFFIVAVLFICVVLSLTTTTTSGIKWTVPPKKKAQPTQTKSQNTNNWDEDTSTSNTNIVTFDLSGHVDCLLCSLDNDDDDDGQQIPLFYSSSQTKKTSSWLIPSSIHIGTDYDFQQVWFGATRLISKFRWKGLSSTSLELSKGLIPNINDSFSTQLTMELPIFPSSSTTQKDEEIIPSSLLQLKWNYPTTNNSQQSSPPILSALARFPIPFFQRLNIESKSIFCLNQQNNNNDYINLLKEPRMSQDGNNWIPDLRLSGTGQLNCISQGRIPSSSLWKNNPSIGVRFSIRRQLDWNAFGFIHQNNNNNDDASLFGRTWFQCQLVDTKDTNTFHSLTISTILEEIQRSTQLTLRREQIYEI